MSEGLVFPPLGGYLDTIPHWGMVSPNLGTPSSAEISAELGVRQREGDVRKFADISLEACSRLDDDEQTLISTEGTHSGPGNVMADIRKTSAGFSADLPDAYGSAREMSPNLETSPWTLLTFQERPLSGIIHESLGRDEQPSIKPDLRPGGELSTVRPTPREG